MKRIIACANSLAITFVTALIVGLPLARPAAAQDRDARRIDTTFAFGRNGWLDIAIPSGTIIVHGWTRPEARVVGRVESGYLVTEISSSRIGLATRSDRSSSRNRSRSSGHETVYEVTVPIGTRVMATSAGGDIRIRGTAGEVQATSAGGNIEVVDATDRITVQTVGGDIRVEKARGRVSIATTGGDLELDDIIGPLSVRAVSSDMRISRVESSDVRIGSTSGDITYEGTVDPKGIYELSTHSGDVGFAIPSGSGAILSLQTYNGEISSAFPMTLQPGENLRRQRGRRMEFEIGGGGARVSITTFSGDITISRGFPRPGREEQ